MDGSNQRRVVDGLANCCDLAWSPDGQELAFSIYNSDSFLDIYTIDINGSNLTNITNNPTSHDTKPSWSPDGSRIAFASKRVADREQIFLMNSDGTGQTLVPTDPSRLAAYPSWSSTGLSLLFSMNAEIYVVNTDGTGLTKIFDAGTHPNWANHPVWSPNGSKIVFNKFTGSTRDLILINADGTGEQNVTNSPEWEGQATWSPDGQRLIYATLATNIAKLQISNSSEALVATGGEGSVHHPILLDPN